MVQVIEEKKFCIVPFKNCIVPPLSRLLVSRRQCDPFINAHMYGFVCGILRHGCISYIRDAKGNEIKIWKITRDCFWGLGYKKGRRRQDESSVLRVFFNKSKYQNRPGQNVSVLLHLQHCLPVVFHSNTQSSPNFDGSSLISDAK